MTQPRCSDCGCLAEDCRCFKPAGATSAGWEKWIADFKAGRIEQVKVSAFPAPPARDQAPVRGQPYPAPSVTSRDAVPGDVSWPGPVSLLLNEADGRGWRTAPAYAKGCMPHATTGRPGAERESWSVLFARDGWQGYAIYSASAWQSIMVAGVTLPPFGKLGRTELSAWLAEPDRPASWYDEIRKRRADQAAAAKERAASRPKKGKEGS